jgi:hypothetical protein
VSNKLEEPCPNQYHGLRGLSAVPLDEFDPLCHTCAAREIMSQHDHLHLGPDWDKCQTLGVGGIPGQNVKCKCGAVHH